MMTKEEQALVDAVELALDYNLYVDEKDVQKYKELTSKNEK